MNKIEQYCVFYNEEGKIFCSRFHSIFYVGYDFEKVQSEFHSENIKIEYIYFNTSNDKYYWNQECFLEAKTSTIIPGKSGFYNCVYIK